MDAKKKQRLAWTLLFLLFLTVECFIGLFVRDRFVRPYVGDLLVVILLYFLTRIFCPKRPVFLSLWILLFAIFVEVTQIYPLVDLLGIQNHFLRVVMGTSFAWGDLAAYGAGSIVNAFLDWRIWTWNKKKTK